MATRSNEIICRACGADTLVVRQPVYEGFTKTGEAFTCAACGHTYPNEAEVPFKQNTSAPAIFSAADHSEPLNLFAEDEGKRICRYCVNYVVNPFTQWCHVHRKEVEATDHCDQFAPRPPDTEAATESHV